MPSYSLELISQIDAYYIGKIRSSIAVKSQTKLRMLERLIERPPKPDKNSLFVLQFARF